MESYPGNQIRGLQCFDVDGDVWLRRQVATSGGNIWWRRLMSSFDDGDNGFDADFSWRRLVRLS